MEVVSTSHMNMEKKIFDPDGRIYRIIVLLDVYEFKPFRELVLHYLAGKAHRVCGSPVPCDVTAEIG